ncbi:hypothetical protein TGAMA5MH_09227 [Trichoderma gamsii]|uniref:Uncharacterized protein n=1 Tax=Trichoderma gamsii TaxID=398673 RepID=A0A2K0T0F6_9HYPO|nr:hypothetical protein TGAMA5MH_09227 [Trichoderma gamsii]
MASSENYGKRLIPQILDNVAATDPDRIVYSIAKSADISQGLQHITAKQFAEAVDKTAWWLQSKVGKSTTLEALGYIGPHDIRHVLLMYASAKAGYKASFHFSISKLKARQC